MGYFNELTFASGYYHIDAHGVVTLAPDTPPEIRERFWKVWPDFQKKVIALEKQGIYSSAYPYLPIEEPDPNRNGEGRARARGGILPKTRKKQVDTARRVRYRKGELPIQGRGRGPCKRRWYRSRAWTSPASSRG